MVGLIDRRTRGIDPAARIISLMALNQAEMGNGIAATNATLDYADANQPQRGGGYDAQSAFYPDGESPGLA